MSWNNNQTSNTSDGKNTCHWERKYGSSRLWSTITICNLEWRDINQRGYSEKNISCMIVYSCLFQVALWGVEAFYATLACVAISRNAYSNVIHHHHQSILGLSNFSSVDLENFGNNPSNSGRPTPSTPLDPLRSQGSGGVDQGFYGVVPGEVPSM